MSEPTNIERAMGAESALCAFDEQARCPGAGFGLRAVDDLYDPPEDVARDLITDLCHFLHLDERAGCLQPEAIRQMLEHAFAMFETEKQECR